MVRGGYKIPDRQARRAFFVAALFLGVSGSASWANEDEHGKRFGGDKPASDLRAASYEPAARAERYLKAVSAYLTQFSGRLLGGVAMGGPATATDLGDAVEILFPGVAVAGGRIRLGDVVTRVKPLEEPRYDVDFSWDGHAGIYANGAESFAVIAADPRMKGRWDAGLRTLAEFDGETGPINLMEGDERVVAARALSVNRRLLPTEKGRWAEESSLRASGLDIGGREGNARIGDVRIEFRRPSFDPEAWLFFSDAFARSRASGKTDETIATRAKEPEAAAEGHGEMRIADIEVVGDDETRFALGKLVLRVDYRERSGNLFIALAAPRVPGIPFHYLPESVSAEIEILEFPLGEFFAETGGSWRTRDQGAFSGLGHRFLSRAGRKAEFRVVGFKFGLPPAEAKAHGTLRSDGAGGLVGELRVRITGLDDYLGALPKSEPREATMFIAFLKGLGRPVAGNDERIAYAYDIDFSSGGLISVNGMPLGPLAE